MPFVVGVTYDLRSEYPVRFGDPPDIAVECDPAERIEAVAAALRAAGVTVRMIGNVRALLVQRACHDIDLVLNLSEGWCGRNRESEVPIVLELAGVPYVGSDATALGAALDKWVAKRLFRSVGIRVPNGFCVARVLDDAPWWVLQYPVVVKPRWEGSGMGMGEGAVARDAEAGKRRARWIIETYRQPALVEEWIDGPEYTVAVVGPSCEVVMPPVERQRDRATGLACHLFDASDYASGCRSLLDTVMLNEAQTAAVALSAGRACRVLGCRDMARVDIRLDGRGVPHVLEVNPLPSMAPDDTFGLLGEMIGVGLDGMLAAVVDAAVVRLGIQHVEWTPGVRLSRVVRHRVSLEHRAGV